MTWLRSACGPFRRLRLGSLAMVVLGAALTAAACGAADVPTADLSRDRSSQDARDTVEEEGERIRVEFGEAGVGATFSEVYLARELGFFEDEGILVGEIPSLGGAVTEALLSGDIDFGMGVGGTDRAIGITQGIEEPIIVGTFTNPTARQIIVSREWIEAHDIRPDQPLAERMAALRGATLAHLAPGPTVSMQNLIIRRHGGLAEDELDVIYIEGGPAAMLASLGKRIDAFLWNPPFGPLAETTGVGAPIAGLAEFPEYQFPELTLTTRRSFAEQNPEVIVRTLRAILRGRQFLHDHPQEAAELLREHVFRDSSLEVLLATLDVLLPVKPMDSLMREEEWQRLIDLMVDIGDLTEPVSAAEGVMWTNAYLREAMESLGETASESSAGGK